MDDKTKGPIDRLLELERIAQQATPGPWCVESLGEKGDGSNVIGVAFSPDDQNAKRPLSGWLEPFDKDGNEIDYYRDEEVAACEHRNRNSGPNAIYIMTFDPPTVLAMIATLRTQADRIEALTREVELLTTAGIVEVAARNPRVLEWLHEIEHRAEAAETRLAALKCCHVCKKPTDIACSDCQINLATTVYVCADPICRDVHERVCSGNLQQRLAALTSAEGCDVEGALDAYMDAPNKGLPYDFLVQQRMSAALAAGVAPLRAKYEALENAARGLSHGTDWNNGTHAKLYGYRQKLLDALSALKEPGNG